MSSLARFQVRAVVARLVRHTHRWVRHTLARAVVLALLLQFFPFQQLPTLDNAQQHEDRSILDLSDITYLVGPGTAHAAISTLSKSGPGSIDQGGSIDYTLIVTDDGSGTSNPIVYDVIDMENIAQVTYASSWWASYSDADNQRTVYFSTTVLAASDVATHVVTVRPNSPITDGTVLTNDLYYARWAPFGGGQWYTGTKAVTTVINAPAYSMDGAVSGDPACAGTLVTYTVFLTNSGHLATTGDFTITVKLDDQVVFAGASDSGIESGGAITWGISGNPLIIGDSINRTFWVTVPSNLENNTVLTYTFQASNPSEVTPDGAYQFTSTVQRVAADFVPSVPVCAGNVTTFTRIYTIPISDGYWDWGDGSPGTSGVADTVTHTYSSSGFYTVTHVVTGTCGGSTVQMHTYTETVFIDGVSASFEPSTVVSVCVGGSVTFTATEVISGPAAGHLWDFGDGQITDTLDVTVVQHTFDTPGYFTVTLTVTNANGCTDVFSRSQIVFVDGLSADLQPSMPISTCLYSDVTFTDTSTVSSTIVAREWDWGDGTISNTGSITTATHTYTVPGYYTVTLTVTNANGCASTRSNTVLVDNVLAAFTATTPLSTCVGGSVGFSSTSVASSTIANYAWNFGDGSPVSSSPTLSQTSHLYNAPGYYTVILTVTSAGGCQVPEVKTDYVSVDGLAASFEPASTITTCSGAATVTFTDTSVVSSTIVAHEWNWGDGTISSTGSITTAIHTYTEPGYYTVILTVTNETGCTAVFSRSNIVFVNGIDPSISAPSPGTSICMVGSSYAELFQSSSVASDTITGHLWDFGDGTISNTGSITYVTHVYTQTGAFTVTLVVTAAGCSDVLVSPDHYFIEKIAPSFDPTQTVTVCAGTTVYFTDTSSVAGGIWSRRWDFGDGTTSPNLISTIYASHTYAVGGSYTVTLTLGGFSCGDVSTQTVGLVSVEDVTTAFTNVATACTGATVPFTFTGQITGTPRSYEWNFGDGMVVTSTTYTTTHDYYSPGEYTVVLTVTTSSGCFEVATGTVSIEGAWVSFEPPTAQPVCYGTGVTFSDTTAYSGTPAYLLWDFGDGITGTDAVTTHVYAAPGSYTVTLTVETAGGCRTSISRTNWVTVEAASVAIEPTTPLTVCIGDTVAFTDASTITPTTAFVSRLWDFGDGTISALPSPTHTFAYGGQFTVTLTVTTAGGCSDTIAKVVSVQGGVVDFEPPAPTTVCYGTGVTFSDTTAYSGTPAYLLWDFGDGITGTSAVTTHVYASSGYYTVTLTVATGAGCTRTLTRTQWITVEEVTTSMAPALPIATCEGASVTFTDTSNVTGTISSRLWEFGDGQTSSGPVATHVYLSPGTYVVTLTVTTAAGCSSWITNTVLVDDINAAFTAIPVSSCLGSSIQFSSTSTASSGIARVEWDFGDGITSTDVLTNHAYAAAGSYTVSLTVENNTGCQRTMTMPVTVGSVSAGITAVGGTAVCQSVPMTFTDSSVATDGIAAWHWYFGDDGSTATTSSVQHTFGTPGTHFVTLTVTTTVGCANATSVIVDVGAQPAPNTAVSPATASVGETVYFTDTGSGGSTWTWSFGDGQGAGPLTTQYVTHTYATAGTYTAVLTVTSVSGCTAVTQQLVSITPGMQNVYLPLVLRNHGPDLSIDSVVLMPPSPSAPEYVLITIRNSGSVPVSDFWVDLYLDPPRAPTVGEIWPELCSQGKAWFVRQVLNPGDTHTLDSRQSDDPSNPETRYSIWPYPLPAGGHTLYALVDSYWRPAGLIPEVNEDNNLYGPVIYSSAASAQSPQPMPIPTPHAQEVATTQPPVATPHPRPTSPEATATPTPGP